MENIIKAVVVLTLVCLGLLTFSPANATSNTEVECGTPAVPAVYGPDTVIPAVPAVYAPDTVIPAVYGPDTVIPGELITPAQDAVYEVLYLYTNRPVHGEPEHGQEERWYVEGEQPGGFVKVVPEQTMQGDLISEATEAVYGPDTVIPGELITPEQIIPGALITPEVPEQIIPGVLITPEIPAGPPCEEPPTCETAPSPELCDQPGDFTATDTFTECGVTTTIESAFTHVWRDGAWEPILAEQTVTVGDGFDDRCAPEPPVKVDDPKPAVVTPTTVTPDVVISTMATLPNTGGGSIWWGLLGGSLMLGGLSLLAYAFRDRLLGGRD